MFFFKQKTAYELRISDWSSDVCSSDLRSASQSRLGRHAARHDRCVDERSRRRRNQCGVTTWRNLRCQVQDRSGEWVTCPGVGRPVSGEVAIGTRGCGGEVHGRRDHRPKLVESIPADAEDRFVLGFHVVRNRILACPNSSSRLEKYRYTKLRDTPALVEIGRAHV